MVPNGLLKETDIMVVGAGHWMASGTQPEVGQWSLSQYADFVVKKAAELRHLVDSRGIRIIWLSMPAFPLALSKVVPLSAVCLFMPEKT